MESYSLFFLNLWSLSLFRLSRNAVLWYDKSGSEHFGNFFDYIQIKLRFIYAHISGRTKRSNNTKLLKLCYIS